MKRKEHPSRSQRPHVALIIETSLGSGRDILAGISRYVREFGPWSIYHEPRSLEDEPPKWIRRWRGDGIIARLQNQKIANAIRSTGLPIVDVLGVAGRARMPFVRVDNTAVARLGAEHLLERGFKNFAYIGLRGVNWSQTRRDAFVVRLAAEHLNCAVHDMPAHIRSDSSWENVQDRLANWLRKQAKPLGILVSSDTQAQRVLEACHRAEFLVPEEVAVLGVDNDQTVCTVCDPPLSSVIVDHFRVGYEAAAVLDGMMHGKRGESPPPITPLGVAERESTEAEVVEDNDVAIALRAIRRHACEGITVDEVLGECLASRSTLQRRFRALRGRSIHEEIAQMRLKRACELLTETDLPIRTIALKTGFRHQEYMGVVFKSLLGQTPAQYRRSSCQKK
ncbi:MAG: XylR family transcriptional regulator [Thermoguttaceae bacterium]